MQAALILLIALAIALASWFAAWYHSRNGSAASRREELERLRNHALWLEQRLDTARRERWDPDMIVALSEQLGVACRQLASAQVRTVGPAYAPSR